MGRSALIVIDVQSALCTGPLWVHEAEAVIRRINGLARRARSAGVPVVWVQHQSADGPLAWGSPGWQWAPGLGVQASDQVQAKSHSDAFQRTELADSLHRQGIDHLVVCGMQSDFCVDSTVRRALALGFPVTLVEDAHTTVDNAVLKAAQITAHHTATLCSLTSYGVRAHPQKAEQVRFDQGSPT